MLYIRQGRMAEAEPLLLDSLSIFDKVIGPTARDTGVCALYLTRLTLRLDRYEEAEQFGRRALACAKAAKGDGPLEAAMAADELAVAVAFVAWRNGDPIKAREALLLSENSLRRFVEAQGPHGKEATRSAVNNQKLEQMLSPLLGAKMPEAAESPRPALAMVTYPFISHAYADRESVQALLATLPAYVKPVVFAVMEVPPTEVVSDKLVSGVLGAEALISIDSAASNASFWTAFERDLAARKGKPMFRFDPRTRTLSEERLRPVNLWIAHLYHSADEVDVSRTMRWLIDERSFEAFDDRTRYGDKSAPPFSTLQPPERDLRLLSVRSFGALYLVFMSRHLARDEALLTHAAVQVAAHPLSTVLCWLDAPEGIDGHPALEGLGQASRERTYAFTKRPTHSAFDVRELDDLMVRLYWAAYHTRPGNWFGN